MIFRVILPFYLCQVGPGVKLKHLSAVYLFRLFLEDDQFTL
jgi:hypothetical protein